MSRIIRLKKALLRASYAVTLALFYEMPCAALTQPAQPYVPADDQVVLERLDRASQASLELRRQQAALAAGPADVNRAAGFAKKAIERGNEEGDPRYFGYAQAALQPWWTLKDPPPQIRMLRAIILQWRHDFGAAIMDLDALIAADHSYVEQARLTRATLFLVQGRPAEARRDCAALIGFVDVLIAATCIASVNATSGEIVRTETALAASIAQFPQSQPSARIWAQTLLAEIAARLAHDELARRSFAAALSEAQLGGHRDVYLLATYSDFLLDQGEAQRVVDLLSDLSRIDNLLLRLALAEAALGRNGNAAMATRARLHATQLQQRFDETRQRGDFVHRREEAIYLLKLVNDAPRALAVARVNWSQQREIIDARIVLEAASAAHNQAAKADVIRWLSDNHIADARLSQLAADHAG